MLNLESSIFNINSMENQNKPLESELLTQLKQKDMLIAALSHDLLNSFNSIMLFSRKLSNDEELPDKFKKPLNTICKSSERAYSMLENLIVWSRYRTTYVGEKSVINNLSQIVSAVIDMYSDKISDKSLIVNVIIDDNHCFSANEEQLFSILRNLLSNAIKFSNSFDLILVTNSSTNEGVSILVSNRGVGIPPERIDTIFSPDVIKKYQGTHGEYGLGFGLILTKELVENNGGKISCQSNDGKDTTFTVSFPIIG